MNDWDQRWMVVAVLGLSFVIGVAVAGSLAWLTRRMEPESQVPKRTRCPSCDERWFGSICQVCGFPERLRELRPSRQECRVSVVRDSRQECRGSVEEEGVA